MVGARVRHADRRQRRPADRRAGHRHRAGGRQRARHREPGAEHLQDRRRRVGGGGPGRPRGGRVHRLQTAGADPELLAVARLFAGVSLAGSTIRADRDANEKIYGVGYSTKNIVVERKVEPTAAAESWLKVLKEKM
jgi:hypothetical protein